MRFADIPQLTSDGGYAVDVPLDYLEEAFGRYVDHYGLDLDVDFQRAHVWTDEQATAFVEHLLRGGTGSNVIRFNKPDWMSGRMDAGEPMVCVDGKQRLTACLRFVRGELPAFNHWIDEYEDQPRHFQGNLKFVVNSLPNRADVLRWYLEINTGGVLHTKAEIRKVKEMLHEELYPAGRKSAG